MRPATGNRRDRSSRSQRGWVRRRTLTTGPDRPVGRRPRTCSRPAPGRRTLAPCTYFSFLSFLFLSFFLSFLFTLFIGAAVAVHFDSPHCRI